MIVDYASLASAVVEHVDREDLEEGSIARFVQMTEAHLRRRLRTMDMETTAELAATDATVALPADLLSIKSVYIAGDPDQALASTSATVLVQQFHGAAGIPTVYARSADELILAPVPDEPIVLEMAYVARFTPLTTLTDNWIIRDHPDVYFYGVLAQAYAFLVDVNAQTFASLFAGAVEELIQARARDKWGSGLKLPSGVRQISGARC